MMSASLALDDVEKLLPEEKPKLAEIAEMPFPLSMCAMRRFYNKDWHKPEHDGDSPAKWSVTFNYSHQESDCHTVDIEAACEAEAKEKAEKQFDHAMQWQNDVKIESVEVEFVEAVNERQAA